MLKLRFSYVLVFTSEYGYFPSSRDIFDKIARLAHARPLLFIATLQLYKLNVVIFDSYSLHCFKRCHYFHVNWPCPLC